MASTIYNELLETIKYIDFTLDLCKKNGEKFDLNWKDYELIISNFKINLNSVGEFNRKLSQKLLNLQKHNYDDFVKKYPNCKKVIEIIKNKN